eukprot:399147_1
MIMDDKNTNQSAIRSRTKDELIVRGFIRENAIALKLTIPSELITLFYDWYHLKHEILTFSTTYQTDKAFKMMDDNKCAIRTSSTKDHAYILSDCQPVFHGKHCWRVYTK